jgi:hypothetical protein
VPDRGGVGLHAVDHDPERFEGDQVRALERHVPRADVSGTGVPGGATIASIDPSGTAMHSLGGGTATGTVTGTFTPTGFGIVHFNRMFAQGQAA